jgi:hypothetical protein
VTKLERNEKHENSAHKNKSKRATKIKTKDSNGSETQVKRKPN